MSELYTATSEARFMPRQGWSIARPKKKQFRSPSVIVYNPRHRPIESESGEDLRENIHTDEDEREAFHELLSVEGFNCVRTNILADGPRHGSAGLQLAFSRQANRNQNPCRGSTQVRSLLQGQSSAPGFPAFHQYRSR